MKVAIAGGHGQVARRLARLLQTRGHEVAAIIRTPAHADDVRDAGAEPVVCDLERATEQELADIVRSRDAVVFAAGAGGGSGPERKWTVDYGGAVKLIGAAQMGGVERYVMLSSIGADPDREGDDVFSVYLRAKGQADIELMESGLRYTIVRPAYLTDADGAGTVRVGELSDDDRISRDDVAHVLCAVLHEPETAGLTFGVAAGEVPVKEAIASLVAITDG